LIKEKDYPRVLICIPVLNRAWVIQYMLRSLMNQTYPKDKIKVVVVDGGSSDGTPRIAEKMLKEGRFDYKIIVKPGNIAEAMNTCLEELRDEQVVLRWDSDVLAHPKSVELLVRLLINSAYHLLGVKVKFLKLKSLEELKTIVVPPPSEVTLKLSPRVIGSFMAIKCSVFHSGIIFNPKMSFVEDVDFSRRAILNGFRIGVAQGFEVVDVDLPSEPYSDIYIYMSLKKLLSGLIDKAKAYGFEIALMPNKKIFLVRLMFLSLAPVLTIIMLLNYFFGINSIFNWSLDVLVIAFVILHFIIYLLNKIQMQYPLTMALKGYIRSVWLLFPMNILSIILFIYYRIASKFNENLRKFLK